MKNFKSKLTKLDKIKITAMIQEIPDYFGEFFITKNNLRLFLKENISLLFEGLKNGDKIIYNETSVAIVTGFSDKFNRHYIKFLLKNLESADNLLKSIQWNLKCDLWAKLKIRNPLVEVLKANGFFWFANRGHECLLCRKVRNYD